MLRSNIAGRRGNAIDFHAPLCGARGAALFIPSLERGSSEPGIDHFVMAITTAEATFWHSVLRQMTRLACTHKLRSNFVAMSAAIFLERAPPVPPETASRTGVRRLSDEPNGHRRDQGQRDEPRLRTSPLRRSPRPGSVEVARPACSAL